MNRPEITFTRVTWQHWLAQIEAFARAPDARRAARTLFAVVISFALASNALNVVNSYVARNFMTALAERDRLQFIAQALVWLGVFALATAVTVLGRYYEDRLGLLWRNWATTRLLERYMARRNYLRVATLSGIENPDQRIAEDIRSFTTVTLSFVLMIFNGSLTVIAFAMVLWTISPALFGVGVLYAAFGTLLSLLLGRPLVRLNYQQLDREADFRAALVHVKENAALVALTGREGNFSGHLRRHLDRLVENAGRVIVVQRNLSYFTTGYNWLIQLIPVLIVAPLFMRGDIEFGVITQSAVAFTHLLGAFSLIVTQTQLLSSLAAVVARLDALLMAIDDSPEEQATGIVTLEDDSRLAYENVTLLSAHRQRVLIADLNLVLLPGARLLVRGAQNDVRAVLMRTTAGIRSSGHGRIVRPHSTQMMFVTEQPYLPDGTLLEILLADDRPLADVVSYRDTVLATVRMVGLEAVLARCVDIATEQRWTSLLTIGEQQLLVCARVLLAGPRFVMVERLSVTLERTTINHMLDLFAQRGITYIVLEPEAQDLEHYEQVLDLAEGGAWQLRRVVQGQLQTSSDTAPI